MKEEAEKSDGAKTHIVDLSWLDSIDPEVEAHLLPTERAIIAALRAYRKAPGSRDKRRK